MSDIDDRLLEILNKTDDYSWGTDISQSAKSVLIHAVLIGILAGMLNSIIFLVGNAGAVSIIIIFIINVVSAYLVLKELFSEINKVITIRINRFKKEIEEIIEEN